MMISSIFLSDFSCTFYFHTVVIAVVRRGWLFSSFSSYAFCHSGLVRSCHCGAVLSSRLFSQKMVCILTRLMYFNTISFMLDRHEKSFGESHQDSSNATLGSRPGKILEVTNAKLRSLGQKVCVETNLEGLASIWNNSSECGHFQVRMSEWRGKNWSHCAQNWYRLGFWPPLWSLVAFGNKPPQKSGLSIPKLQTGVWNKVSLRANFWVHGSMFMFSQFRCQSTKNDLLPIQMQCPQMVVYRSLATRLNIDGIWTQKMVTVYSLGQVYLLDVW